MAEVLAVTFGEHSDSVIDVVAAVAALMHAEARHISTDARIEGRAAGGGGDRRSPGQPAAVVAVGVRARTARTPCVGGSWIGC